MNRPENCKHLADYDYLMKSMTEGLPLEMRKNYASNEAILDSIKRNRHKTSNQKTNQIMTIMLLGMIEETS